MEGMLVTVQYAYLFNLLLGFIIGYGVRSFVAAWP